MMSTTGPTCRLRPWAAVALCALSLLLPACESGGHFSICGYTTEPNYDCNIHTVYVPIFENRTLRRGIEFELTQAVITQIEAKTPFKVVHDCEAADTELLGKIVTFNKSILNMNQQNEVREGQTLLTVEVVWKDRRTGEVLSGPGRRIGDFATPAMQVPSVTAQPVAIGGPTGTSTPPTDPACPPVPKPIPVLVTSIGTFIPELGESLTTSEKKNVDRLAIQIVSMMEKPW